MDETTDVGVESAAQDNNPEPSATSSPAAQPAAPVQPQQQGPDWNSLASQYGGYEGVQQRLNYYRELEQRYQQDPQWAQQYDKVYGAQGQQQPQAHPYDWMNYDDQRVAKLREYGANPDTQNHPDFQKHNAEINNLMYNPLGQLSQYVTHPKVMEPLYDAMAPQVQDMVSRMLQQQLQPINQHMHQQAQSQFRQQYEKPFMALPENVKQAFQKGFFGQGNQAIINAVEFAKMSPQQQADAGIGATEQPKVQPAVNKNTAVNKTGKKDDDDADLKQAARAWGEMKKK